MLCSRGEKDDEKKKGPLAKCGAKAKAQSGRTVFTKHGYEERNKAWRASNSPGKEQSWKSKMRSKILETKAKATIITQHDDDQEWQEYMLEECSDDSGVNNDADEDVSEEAKKMLKRHRVEAEEAKQRRQNCRFYAGKAAGKAAAEEPEEEPKASGSSSSN